MAEVNIHFDLTLGPKRLRVLLAAAMILAAAPELESESVTLTTYYPAPSGVYTNMITTDNTYLARDAGSVGIRNSAPANTLDVTGTFRATSNGTIGGNLSVTGSGAIGTTLSVGSNATIGGSATVGNGLALTGAQSGAYGLIPSYAAWASYGTGNGGAAIYNDASGYNALMIVGNNFAGGSRRVRMWDDARVEGTMTVTNGACTPTSYTTSGVTFCPGGTYAAVTSGLIAKYSIMPMYRDQAGNSATGMMLCCTCPTGGCPSL